MSTMDLVGMHKQYVMGTYAPDLTLVRGRGAQVWDDQDKEYLDFLTGISVLNVGHGHPKVIGAIARQSVKLMHVSNLFYNEMQPQLAKALSERSLGGKCFFCNSGAEANEGMFKLARLWGHEQGKYEIISMRNSFHGRTLAALTATGQTKYQKGFEPMVPGFAYADFNNLDSVKAAITGKTVAVLVEAVQGEGGIIPATAEFMAGVRALCDEKGLLMLCDEVQCGMGRTGKWFGFQNFSIKPDAFSLAKSLGGGFPIGAIVASPKVSDVFKPGNHASTFGGNPLACSAALAVIEAMEEEQMLDNALHVGGLFMSELKALATRQPLIKAVRGVGLMVGVVFDMPTKPLEVILRKNGLIALATAEKIIRFLPPLNVSEAQIRQAVKMMEESCAQWAAELKKGGS